MNFLLYICIGYLNLFRMKTNFIFIILFLLTLIQSASAYPFVL